MEDDFLMDEAGEIQNQRYRIGQMVTDEVRRRDNVAVDLQEARRIAVRPYTKYEQQIMDRIPARQKANVIQKQVVCGKPYSGEGFLPTPKKVEFFDFDVGETYKAVVNLTNVSRSFNAFRVLDLPAEVRDVLEVTYAPASTMSAGMSSKITVIFTPKENVDIETHIPMLAKTGNFIIPVKCTRKRVVMTASTKLANFGSCVIAENVERSVVLRNDGALPVNFTVTGDLLTTLKETQTASNGKHGRLLSMNLQKLNNVRIDAFSAITLIFQYTPLVPSQLSTSMYLQFSNEEVDDMVIFFSGSAMDVPVYVSRNRLLNLNCCFHETLYRDVVTVRNTTKSAVHVQPETPAALQGVLDYVPKFGFVQPDSSLDFQVRLTPDEKLGSEVDIKVPITVAGQAMPIYYELQASLTTHDVIFDPPNLAFGYCAVGEALAQEVSVTNSSRLIRRMTFVKLPPNVKVRPRPVFVLKPGESTRLTVCFEAAAPGPAQHLLQLKTETDESYTLEVRCEGKAPPLRFSASNLKMPNCAFYDMASATTLLSNTTSTLQRYCFALNPRYNIDISPSHGAIQAGQVIPVTVSFKPNPSAMVESSVLTGDQINAEAEAEVAREFDKLFGKAVTPAAPEKKKKNKAEEEAERQEREKREDWRRTRLAALVAEKKKEREEIKNLVPWEVSTEGEPLSHHRTIAVPCFIEGWKCQAVFLEVSTTVGGGALLPVQGTANNKDISVDLDGSLAMDFASVPALQNVRRAMVLQNDSEETIEIDTEALDPFGPFHIVRPPPPTLGVGHDCEVVLEFRPSTQAAFRQEAVFKTSKNTLRLTLRGEGLPAVLTLTEKGAPISEEISEVDLGSAVVGDTTTERQLTAHNSSPFPLTVEASFLPLSIPHFNPNGSVPFQMTPSRFTLPAEGKQDLTLSFLPLKESPFSATLELEYGGAGTAKKLRCLGSGWDKGLYVVFPQQESNYTSNVYLNHFADVTNDGAPGLGTQVNPLNINLAAAEGETAEAVTVIGNNKSSTNGEFTLEGLTDSDTKNGWKVDVTKAAVAPGAHTNLVISFTPSQLLLDSLPLRRIGVVTLAHVKLSIKGGSPFTEHSYFIRLKGTAERQ